MPSPMQEIARGASPSPGPVADLHAVRGIGAGRACRACRTSRPELVEVERCAQAIRSLGLEPLPSAANFLFVSCDRRGCALLRRCCAPASSSGRSQTGSASACATARTTTSCSNPWPAPSTLPAPVTSSGPAPKGASPARYRLRPRVRVRLGLDGESRVRVATGSGNLRPLSRAAGLPREGSISCSRLPEISRRGPHHTAEDAALTLGEALDARRSATGVGSHGTEMRWW